VSGIKMDNAIDWMALRLIMATGTVSGISRGENSLKRHGNKQLPVWSVYD
jgi:hypothetical protein